MRLFAVVLRELSCAEQCLLSAQGTGLSLAVLRWQAAGGQTCARPEECGEESYLPLLAAKGPVQETHTARLGSRCH